MMGSPPLTDPRIARLKPFGAGAAFCVGQRQRSGAMSDHAGPVSDEPLCAVHRKHGYANCLAVFQDVVVVEHVDLLR
jgi:hypothetical protein